ncbi:hypothetical protein KNJ79_05465 [Sphingopyxis indica]|uniref:hypothetical protein n=1 Tax=Sphingopyxis indica TaxID=436663 RepID=UPI00293911AE|nr:hypothetical protein [Sphingopyxis indica]WOF44382.1 hypothetical protein KNJ79_05465 [Sphingopyxis indica]
MANDPANAAQVKVIAEQMLDVWEARQGKKNASWPAWGGLVLSVLGIAYMAGGLSGDVAIAKTDAAAARAKVEAVDTRLSRLEENVKFLVDAEKERRKR